MKNITKDHTDITSALNNIKSLMHKNKELVDMRSNILDLTQVVNYNTPEVTSGNNDITDKIKQEHAYPSTIKDKLKSDLETQKDAVTNLQTTVNNIVIQDDAILNNAQIMSLTKEILYAELKAWLNNNLPGIVREVVEQQVQLLILDSNKKHYED